MQGELRRLTIKCFHVRNVVIGTKVALNNGALTLPSLDNDLLNKFDKVSKLAVSIIEPKKHDIEINTIMDIMPISAKVLGILGDGITHTLTGVYVMLTGGDEDGRQMHEFGSSEGILKDKLMLGKAGTPNEDDYIIHIDVLLKSGLSFTRSLAFLMFQICDSIIQPIRDVLKIKNGKDVDEKYVYYDEVKKGKTKIAIVKQVAGQGAMYDNLLFPNEPSGIEGGISIMDIGNMPVVLTPNEYRDGALRSLT
ncbi:proline reductase cluster protein PrdD [Neobacillus niacini]|uniref:proline reductase cluster protein PrdD n=1 Tax=Neobacillus niacini TaxID=86668 RepID=UPI0028627EFA|nr:proline reductase cluster protein PrdD [Neobacillus niacini]MDR7001953.1 D-proline reductase (dithiol) PrdD [Neobacillus niacini]